MEYGTFSIIINKALESKLKPLIEEIEMLRRQVEILKESSIDLIELLIKNKSALSESNIFSPFVSSLGLNVRNEENSQNKMVVKNNKLKKWVINLSQQVIVRLKHLLCNRAIQVMSMMVSGKLKKSDDARRE
ncbi:hypothetical protein Zmor_011026 [Zophobas morio]|mgnify:CR=1 FL=1|uniref:Uncharacterized protein n=1 Tax=Zophobas morio TaxID=2755281 RepID=A0AA38ISN0_9CUCU|nr:hypothetical protein Zmor_011026 [Zophobas morio]